MLLQFIVVTDHCAAPFAGYRPTVLKVIDVIGVVGEHIVAVCEFETWVAGRLILLGFTCGVSFVGRFGT